MPLEARDATRLADMMRHAKLARDILAGRTLDALRSDAVAQLAIVRCLEVIGEAGHQVSAAVQQALPTIPWHRMWAMRNRLIHDYGNTDIKIVHDVVSADLVVLIRDLEGFLARSP
jgi:uncharacterized protein with HEPN domain